MKDRFLPVEISKNKEWPKMGMVYEVNDNRL